MNKYVWKLIDIVCVLAMAFAIAGFIVTTIEFLLS